MLQRAVELLRAVDVESLEWLARVEAFLAEYDAAMIKQSQGDLAHAKFIRELASQTPPHAQVL